MLNMQNFNFITITNQKMINISNKLKKLKKKEKIKAIKKIIVA